MLRPRAWVALVIALLLSLGCASASVEGRRVDTGDRIIPKPPVLLVYPFALDSDDVAVDTLGFSDATHEDRSSENLRIQSELLFQTVSKLNERGINAKSGTDVTEIPLNALLVKGQFVTIDEGNRARRMIIGFGAGAERLTTQIQVYHSTPPHPPPPGGGGAGAPPPPPPPEAVECPGWPCPSWVAPPPAARHRRP